jgi:hypothetical protein
MTTPIAKPVVKNKFWVVENQGEKIATIQAVNHGGVVYVHNEQREFFPSVKVLKQKYNIKFSSTAKPQKNSTSKVYGFPISGKSYNVVYDVKNRIPIYTKTEKSKSQYCAGYYLILSNNVWSKHFCPKRITITRYQFCGPYQNEEDITIKLKELTNAET